ncbi:MAG TPA: low molecular weight phosphatase family protein [Corynebacterium variabile]|uniref:Low molecular weight phosphatase family protein n=1 Tax=Corynebacterium variabile TaxID=1727 RepID=A0A3B9QW66_9CORY|nr:low molecular weight phosphatase family protein [Corynebacterium variabile]
MSTSDRVPSVLFVCVSNAGKSRMAEALAENLRSTSGIQLTIHSAGTRPSTAANAESVAALDEIGVRSPDAAPKPVDPDLLRTSDRVILLGTDAQLTLPEGARGTLERWVTDEPSTRGIGGMERMRLVRDDIAARVRELVREMTDGD